MKKNFKNQLKDLCYKNSTNFFFLDREKKKKKTLLTFLFYFIEFQSIKFASDV